MNKDHKAQQLEADNKAAQIHAEHVKAAVIDTALRVPPAVAFWSPRLGVKPGNFDISLFVNNILDKSTWTRRERASNPFEFFRRETLRPRTSGVTASYRM